MGNMDNSAENLLQEAKTIIKNNYEAKKNRGGDFNIFSILKIERDEVFTHSNMIYSLLNSQSGHFMEDKYLKSFLNIVLGIKGADIYKKWYVEREWPFEDGRIDFVIYNDDWFFAIEMKIDAGDQDHQLKRYEDYAKTRGKDYKIFYLTLDGKEPSSQSEEGMERKPYLISFEKHILEWLKKCIDETPVQYKARDALKQYRELVNKIINNEGVEKQMVSILMKKENYKAFKELQKSENIMKQEFVEKFCEELEKRFEQNSLIFENITDENLKIVEPKKFFSDSNTLINYEINIMKDFNLNGSKFSVVFVVEISNSSDSRKDGTLVFGLKLKNTLDGTYFNFSQNQITLEDRNNLMNLFNLNNYNKKYIMSSFWIYWDYIYTEGKGVYALREFNDNVINMLDNESFSKEMDRIINSILISYKSFYKGE